MNFPVNIEKPLLLQAPALHTPSVVIVSSFEPKMKSKQEVESGVKRLVEQAEQQLMALHRAEDALPVIGRLRQQVRKLDYSTHRRSVAVFVSAEVEKICYLDMEVETGVFVDENIRVRDLAGFRRPNKDFLVLVLGDRQSRMYLSQGDGLRLIKSNVPEVGVTAHQFMYQMDHGLEAVLKLYPLPVFVVAPGKVAAHFGSITHHACSIAAYVQKDAVEATACELQGYLEAELIDFEQVRERIILQRIQKAADAGRMAQGIQAVARAAGSRNGRLLVVEEDRTACGSFYKNGIIDEIAEKVLISGGEIETLNNGGLDKYGHVVLLLER